MTINVGWKGVRKARGAFYTRWKNRFNHKEGIEYVQKHRGEAYKNVEIRNGKLEGIGFIGTEPKYANLSGDDRRIHISPKPHPINIKEIRVTGRQPIVLRKPVTFFKS